MQYLDSADVSNGRYESGLTIQIPTAVGFNGVRTFVGSALVQGPGLPSNGVYMLGATMIEAGERTRVTARSLLELLSAAYALHPAFGEAEVLEIGVDARPAFPDNLPRIRRRGATIYVNGLYRHGFLLAPALARMAAELVLEGRTPEVMDEDTAER